jgi:hypothetical protein
MVLLNLEIGNNVGIVLFIKDDQVLLKLTAGIPPDLWCYKSAQIRIYIMTWPVKRLRAMP